MQNMLNTIIFQNVNQVEQKVLMFPFMVGFWFHFSEPGPVGVLQTSATSEDHQPFASWDEPKGQQLFC